jgi:hypothetical protein
LQLQVDIGVWNWKYNLLESSMKRRDWLQKTLFGAMAGVAGTSLAQTQTLTTAPASKYAGELDMLQGQEGGAGPSPREQHAYTMGLQAFEYGFPLIYFANLNWKWAKDPKSALRPLNSWITTKDFVATSNYRDGGSFNTDTVYAGAFIDLRKGPMVLSTKDPEGHYFSVQLSDFYTNNFAYISKRSGGPIFGDFLLLPPGWTGEVPKGKFDRVLQCE